MKVLVCGSRDWTDEWFLDTVIDGLLERCQYNLEIIHGACPTGADAMADQWRETVEVKSYPAFWELSGKAAGPIRNQLMLDDGKPDIVVAFVNKPLEESRGTFDMVKRARAANIPTYVIST